MRKSTKTNTAAKILASKKVPAKRRGRPAKNAVKAPAKVKVAPKKPVTQIVEKMISSLAIKSTQSITGKVKYLKDAVMVGETLIPMTSILVVANNTVFYTKFSKVGNIVAVEQKNDLVAYKLDTGAIVTVVDPASVQVMVETLKEEVPVEEEEEPEEEEESEEDEDDSEDEEEEEDEEEYEEEDDDEDDEEEEDEEEDDDDFEM